MRTSPRPRTGAHKRLQFKAELAKQRVLSVLHTHTQERGEGLLWGGMTQKQIFPEKPTQRRWQQQQGL